MRFANPPRSRSLLFPELTLTHVRQGKRQHGGIVSDNNGGNVQPGWYPSDGQMRYWDGNAWTEQTRPLQADAASVPTQPYGQPQQPVQPVYVVGQKKSHTLRNVLLILVLLMVLFVGGCFALLGVAGNEVSKSIDKSISDEAANDKPVAVAEGAAFDHDGFATAKGWKVAPQEFGGVTIKGLSVTLEDDQDVSGGGRTALFTFRLYDGKTVVSEITCSSNEMQEGETTRMDCFSGETEKVGKWDTIKVADAF